MKKAFLLSLAITPLLLGCAQSQKRPALPRKIPIPAEQAVEKPIKPALQAATILPSVQLGVPFTPQAPFANWDPPFDEACEEAALLMVHHFFEGTDLTKEEATGELLALIAWQTKRKYEVDISLSELAEVAKQYYGLTPTIYEGDDVNPDHMKTLLSAGYPIIIPAAGQLLNNPYFSGDGPPYHMLVLTGFDRGHFYTNDPGTRRGENYAYTKSTIMNAIHDWTGSVDTIERGGKADVGTQEKSLKFTRQVTVSKYPVAAYFYQKNYESKAKNNRYEYR